jgi:membrane fusion protein (multidrug efflux system)
MKNSQLIILSSLAVACTTGKASESPLAPEPAPVHAETIKVVGQPMPHDLAVTGQLVANLQADVAANAAGKVIKTFIDRGSYVHAGDTLALLDTSAAALSEAQAKANLQVAVAAQELADTLCKRSKELFEKGALAREEWERTENQCRTSAASTDAARAQVAMVSKTMTDATVRAPFAGAVNERYVSVGEYVQPPSRVVNLVELDPLRLQMTVAEADVGHVHPGQVVKFAVDAFPDRTFTGKVRYVDPSVRSSSRDLIVEAVVQNEDQVLKPGMFALAHLQQQDEERPVVPVEALLSEGSTTRLFAVVNGHAEERIVQRGPERDGKVAILDGIKVGEQVVSRISESVRDGIPIK